MRAFEAVSTDRSGTRKRATMRRVAWWIIKFSSGVVAIFGAIVVGWVSVELFFLITGRVTLYADKQPSIMNLVMALFAGTALVIGGYKIPKWFDIDRLL